MRRILVLSIALAGVLALASCAPAARPPSAPPTAKAEGVSMPAPKAGQSTAVVVETTTAVRRSGLFDALIPAFEKENPGVKVEVRAGGAAAAAGGEVVTQPGSDIQLGNDKNAQLALVGSGAGVERVPVLYREYVIVGPASDPAGIKGAGALDALRALIDKNAKFVGTGDYSDVMDMENRLWHTAGRLPNLAPIGKAPYVSAGEGIRTVLRIASEEQRYTLSDAATFRELKGSLRLVALVEGDPVLRDQYAAVPMEGSKNAKAAQVFLKWLTGSAGQDAIRRFGADKPGGALFVPNAEAAR